MKTIRWSFAVCALVMVGAFASCNKPPADTTATTPTPSQATANQSDRDKDLEKRLRAICERAQGVVAVAVTHVETGRTVGVNAAARLPLYSVFKLPLAITVLKDVEANRLKLDQLVHVAPDDVVPGAPENTALWREPADHTIARLIEVSIARSDNTSTEKLLRLVGGPTRVTEEMRTLGLNNLDIRFYGTDFLKARENVNTGSAEDLVKLLVQLQEGNILAPAQTKLLIDDMRATTTGPKRLPGDLPAGTVVGHKTGSGLRDPDTNVPKATNDVGLITLPNGGGTLAIAVLVSDSTLADIAQEKLIAELARTAYDDFSVLR
ncbi:MAG TPA: class A beta-lactamase [Pyrinomonadaceae bacterium]|nr:class A beta-lactamase [Pyrinomonadaceae bacterium]